jgi:hypothetical protein
MGKKEVRAPASDKQGRRPYHIRVPGFITDEDIGLGDVIKSMTYAAGIKPCDRCERRAAALNRRLVFSGKRPK